MCYSKRNFHRLLIILLEHRYSLVGPEGLGALEHPERLQLLEHLERPWRRYFLGVLERLEG